VTTNLLTLKNIIDCHFTIQIQSNENLLYYLTITETIQKYFFSQVTFMDIYWGKIEYKNA